MPFHCLSTCSWPFTALHWPFRWAQVPTVPEYGTDGCNDTRRCLNPPRSEKRPPPHTEKRPSPAGAHHLPVWCTPRQHCRGCALSARFDADVVLYNKVPAARCPLQRAAHSCGFPPPPSSSSSSSLILPTPPHVFSLLQGEGGGGGGGGGEGGENGILKSSQEASCAGPAAFRHLSTHGAAGGGGRCQAADAVVAAANANGAKIETVSACLLAVMAVSTRRGQHAVTAGHGLVSWVPAVNTRHGQ